MSENIYKKFTAAGLSHVGACAMLGNFEAESALRPNNLQNSFEKSGISDEVYTLAVDKGLYKNFANDQAGYGYAQWTHPDRKKQLLAFVQQRGVSIAFENLEGAEYLCALLTRYQNHPNVGFCWDCGHDACYPPKTDLLRRFGDKLIMTHLHDNFGVRDPAGILNGKDDLHFIPYDGSNDWEHTISRLQSAARQEILNFELKTRTKSKDEADLPYLHLSL